MQIQPLHPVEVCIKSGDLKATCQLIELTEQEMTLLSAEYLEKDSLIDFKSQFFNGQAVIHQINFQQNQFKYSLTIKEIRFQPGLLINTRL